MSDPRITDEAVEVTAAQLWHFVWSDVDPYSNASEAEKDVCRRSARDVLNDAVPLLAPQPVVDREVLIEALINLHASRKGGWVMEQDMQDAREEVDAVLALLNGGAS